MLYVYILYSPPLKSRSRLIDTNERQSFKTLGGATRKSFEREIEDKSADL